MMNSAAFAAGYTAQMSGIPFDTVPCFKSLADRESWRQGWSCSAEDQRFSAWAAQLRPDGGSRDGEDDATARR